MKTQLFYPLAVLFITVVGAGCSAFQPGITTVTHNASQVILDEADFVVVKRAEGVETVRYFFGMGGVLKNGLVGAAKADLYNNAGLTGSQAIIDTHVEFKTSLIIPYVWGSVRCVATGTVIEFK